MIKNFNIYIYCGVMYLLFGLRFSKSSLNVNCIDMYDGWLILRMLGIKLPLSSACLIWQTISALSVL